MESYTHTPNKTIHILEIPAGNIGDREFEVGRSSSVSVRITGKVGYFNFKWILDISVSRIHAKFTFHNGNFYLKDLESKFGTVTRLWHPISIPDKKHYSIDFQIGRSYISVSSAGRFNPVSKKKK